MSNNPRILLWGALGLVLWFNYQTWEHDYAPATAAPEAAQALHGPAAPSSRLGATVPHASSSSSEATPTSPAAAASSSAAVIPSASPGEPSSALVHVRTDVLELEISLQGGTLQEADLLKYPRVKGGTEPVRLLNHDSPQSLYLLQSGLTSSGDGARPTHLVAFSAARERYELGNASELRVPLTWTDEHGVTVTKTYILHRGEYRVGLEYTVENHTDSPWQAADYTQILRNDPRTSRSMFNVESYAFHGPAIHDGTKYRKLNIEDADDRHLTLEVRNGWLAALQHHFVSAVVPAAGASYRFTLNVDGNQYLLAAMGPIRTVAAGQTESFQETLFIGPKLQGPLEAAAPHLELVADYGKLTILAKPLFLLLEKLHALFGNWGVAIIVATFLLKLLFYPLSEASGRSMAKMKQLAPRIKNLQDTHKDDREKLGRSMMELYQREKINPVAGCLPIIIQFPVFLAFYWVLLESVEMRQAPFAFWIHDLSSRDPLFILPLIMAGAMFVQYKLNPAPPDPVQAKVFMFMPFVMSFTFAFFPAGLVLYWVTNTILSIAQQWNINRRITAATARKISKV